MASMPFLELSRTAIIALSSHQPYGAHVKSQRPMFATASRPFRRAVFESIEARVLLAAGGTLQGIAWEDLNGDGALQADEPLLSNWNIYLDANHNAKFDAG